MHKLFNTDKLCGKTFLFLCLSCAYIFVLSTSTVFSIVSTIQGYYYRRSVDVLAMVVFYNGIELKKADRK